MNFLASQLAVYSGWALCMKPIEGLVQRKVLKTGDWFKTSLPFTHLHGHDTLILQSQL